jgi:hypothetical protein
MTGGRDVRKMTRQECALKAVEALTTKAKFPFAEVTEDGNARGWNGKMAILVLSFQTPDPERIGIMMVGAGAGGDGAEIHRTCLMVKDHICDGPANPKTPARVIPDDGKVPPAPCMMCWKSEERPTSGVLKFFDPAALICLEKKGYSGSTGGGITIAGGPGSTMMMFLAPTTNGQTVRLNVVSATPGQDPAVKATEDMLSRLGKLLYE